MPRVLPLLLILLVGVPTARGQERTVIRGDSLGAIGDGAFRDTLSLREPRVRPFVIPRTLDLRLDGAPVDTADYHLDARTGRIVLTMRPSPPPSAVLTATYRTLPLQRFAQPLALRRVDTTAADTLGRQRVVEEAGGTDEPLFGSLPQLRRSGAISRGIVAGNRRDVSIESGLRMELDGEVADGVRVQAVLTDENTPIQPEGTTQRLSDFDRVYVQLDADLGQARLGDVDLAFTGTEFAPFVRKLQGAAVTAEVPAALGGAFAGGRVTAAGAVTRGLFRSQDVEAVEGVQGPYRLTGQNGEELIIIVAGSERVYLDGVLMQRGEAQDYVIDYGTGEVTFTPRRLITAERRITVDFEYSLGAFTRTLLGTEVDLGFGRMGEGALARPRARLRATLLREADGAAFADELGLTEADLDLIAVAGDAPAVRSGAEPVPFDAESPFVLYTQQDTLFGGEVFSVFVPAGPDDADVFRVRFSRVEPGTGQYVRAGRAVNGVLFEWVGPAGGDYVPLRLLPKPALRSLLDLAATVEPVMGIELFGEAARSTDDPNRISDLNASDDAGGAYFGGARLRPTEALGGLLLAEVTGRLREATFRPFSRIRPVEFNRHWNLARAGSGLPGLDSLREETVEGFAQWSSGEGGSERVLVRAEAGRLVLGDLFDGERAGATFLLGDGWLGGLPGFDYRVDWVEAENGLVGEEGGWLRQLGRLSKPLLQQKITSFVEVEQERRAQRVIGTDSLAATALAFVEVRPGVRWVGEEGRRAAGLQFEYRDEQLPFDGRFARAARVATVKADGRYRLGSTFSTEAEAAYRRRNATDAFRLRGDPSTGSGQALESVALRWTSRWSPLDRAADLNAVYEATTERAPVLQEVYLRVGPELGQYVWEDANGDGVQQLDEFREEITPLEGEYVRSFVPGDRLRPTAAVQGRLRLRLDPARFLGDDALGWRRVLRAVTTLTTLDVQERTESDELLDVYLLRPHELQQPGRTLAGRFRVGQDVTLFRGDPRFGGRLSANHLRTTTRLASGLERRLVQRAEAEARVQALPPLGLALRGAVERRDAESPFASRAFALRGWEAEPEATWRFGPGAALTAGVRLARNRDVQGAAGAERTADIVIVPVQTRLSAANRLQLLLSAERADVRLAGPAAVGETLFELTERRGVGTSYLWSANGQYTVNRYLRASLTYEGRAPAAAPVLHNVRLSLSAVF